MFEVGPYRWQKHWLLHFDALQVRGRCRRRRRFPARPLLLRCRRATACHTRLAPCPTPAQCPPWPHMAWPMDGPEAAKRVSGGLFPHPPPPAMFAAEARPVLLWGVLPGLYMLALAVCLPRSPRP